MTFTVNAHLHLDVGPGGEDSASPVDISDRLTPPNVEGDALTVDWTYGRSLELDRMAAGRGTVWIDNRDRAFDPANSSSPHHDSLLPWKRLTATVTVDDTTFPLCEGHILDWPQRHPVWGWRAVELPVVDCIGWLERRTVDLDLPAQPSGERIHALLDLAGWPASKRDIDDGRVTLEPVERDTVNLWAALEDTADAEDGQIFAAPSGDVTFHDRHHRLDLDGTMTPVLALDDQDYVHALPGRDDQAIISKAVVALANGDEFIFISPESDDEFGEQEWTRFDLPLRAVEARALGAWAVVRWSESRVRMGRIVADGAVFPQAAASTVFGDLLEVTSTDGDVYEVSVERVEHRIGRGWWETVWTPSPWFGEGPWLIWDSETEGQRWDEGAWAP